MTMRFLKCVVVVTLVHLFAALLVFGAYHFTRAGNDSKEGVVPSETQDYTLMQTGATSEQLTPPTPPPEPDPVVHKVTRGESYWTIARRYGVTTDNLMAANGHSRDHVLKIGERLIIPAK